MDDHEFIREKIRDLINIVNELEKRFPGRKFSLDGHLLGSIGEVLAQYYYGIDLYANNTKTHDGEVDGKKVQIKITQGDSVDINDIPDYLLVLFLNKATGEVFEVYNGPCDWLEECKKTKNGWYSRSIIRLSKQDQSITDEMRIMQIKPIKKWNQSIRNE